MKVLILVTLLTLSSAVKSSLNFSEIRKNLDALRNAKDLVMSNGSHIQPALNNTHPCECEVIFFENLNEFLKSVRSSSHKDHLRNIMDIIKGLHLPKNMRKPEKETCEKPPKVVKRNILKRRLIINYIHSSIDFIHTWNLKSCQRHSGITNMPKNKD